MKALVKAKAARGLWMQDVAKPDFGRNDVLIKIKRTSICGTDIHIYEWDEWAQKTIPVPLVTGHEYSGVIEAMGSDVRGLQIGQRVSGEGHIIGNRSRNSRAGRFHLDPDTKGVGVNRPGAFAEYLVIPAFNVVPLPDHVSFDLGAILDPFGNAVHTALSFDLVGEDVLVTGAGPIGTMAAAVARFAGARHVVITDINPYRLDLAAKVADVRPVNVLKEDLKDVMAQLGMVEGFDIGLEMSGSPAAFEQMIDTMIMGGKIALLGIPAGRTEVNWGNIIFKALTLKGIYGREMFDTWYKMLAMLGKGVNLEPLITHRFAAADYETGFSIMHSGQSGKIILNWDNV
ncbi:MAG TPA: L-threonine 3-dehydrogenase [Anaerolineae bacterium]|nr:L-threonine 3-dehydrogenase [Anaerolineae bacterium]